METSLNPWKPASDSIDDNVSDSAAQFPVSSLTSSPAPSVVNSKTSGIISVFFLLKFLLVEIY